MKKLIVVLAVALLLPLAAMAQTATGQLTVTATVQSSISLTFHSDASGVPLSVEDTTASTLAFGNVSAYGTPTAGATVTPGASSFTVSSPVGITVNQANTGFSNYKLDAQLQAADTLGNIWKVAGVSINDASATTVAASAPSGSTTPYTVAITVPNSVTSGTSISNVINFTATAD